MPGDVTVYNLFAAGVEGDLFIEENIEVISCQI